MIKNKSKDNHPSREKLFVVFHVPKTRPQEVIAIFNPSTPDRTKAILHGSRSPLPFLLDSYSLLRTLGVKTAAISCNTMHYWYNKQKKTQRKSPIHFINTLHMIELTAKAIAQKKLTKVGLLATTGTLNTKLYQKVLKKEGITVLSLEQKLPLRQISQKKKKELYLRFGVNQNGHIAKNNFIHLKNDLIQTLGEQEGLVMESIYGPFGIKAGFSKGIAGNLMEEAVKLLSAKGAQGLIWGCTEIPLMLKGKSKNIQGKRISIFDPSEIVADRLKRLGKQGKKIGLAGGLGPAATLDMLQKMKVGKKAIRYLKSLYEETIRQLKKKNQTEIKDQHHLKFIFIQTRKAVMYLKAMKKMDPLFIAFTDPKNESWPEGDKFPFKRNLAEIVKKGLQAKVGL